ncbi:methylated-DNA--[protein]-cysteine S-methyltransferase [Snuella sedimenti]|uniref:Methylated-DNA--protein-cysteine methyltransferase n=1 Tax=Snuella sedimenti TaxID=2798802 RepID=A0A8J7J0M3_9FLAO|nr:methylated-DNA--[protein]-cysteine S-methyltransferase [Snuella sedimenti]MBJ6367357.1 methylated-DNA--[protein]-cysteine S-methyltransferase [Snuella sedimenti]
MESCIIKSPIGYTKISGDINGITSITVLNSEETITNIIPEVLQDCDYQLKEYFEGSRKIFTLKLNPSGTPFQKQVWEELLKIPYGKTITYLELSKKMGDAKAIRAVASANGKNPLWIVVPCHRVIGSDGSLTGYAGGLHRKQWLLEHESPYKQQSLF